MTFSGFRKQLKEEGGLVGTFIKTPNYQIVEIISSCDLSFIVLDAEHAPFGKIELDTSILAAKSSDTPVIVRIPSLSEENILSVLDMGANGVLIPHVNTGKDAEYATKASRYLSSECQQGHRGFSNSSRSGGYGSLSMQEMIEQSNNSTAVICQIEEKEAVENINEIVKTEGIDCLFIGRADLALSLGCNDIEDEKVNQAIDLVTAAAKKANIRLGIYLSDKNDIEGWQKKGFSLFVIGSDQSHLKASISQIRNNI